MPDVRADWQDVEARYADLPGDDGIATRLEAYRPYFLRLGANVIIEAGCRFAFPDRIVLDDDVRINLRGLFYGSGGIRIGRHARIGPRVFIHSANHDVDREDSRAFFERGYDYQAVDIGENVLLSADVRILPGARLGATSFVAAGATVTGKTFAEGCYLAGSPARIMAAPASGQDTVATSPATTAAAVTSGAEIAIVLADRSSDRGRVFAHLLGVLGLPQIMLAEVGDTLPSSLTAVLLDEGQSEADAFPDHVEVWRIAAGNRPLSPVDGAVQLALPGSDETVRLPAQRRSRYRPRADRQSSPAERARAYAFWLQDRLVKREDVLPLGEFLEWAVSLQLLAIEPGRNDRLLELILESLWRRWPEDLPRPATPPAVATVADRDVLIHGWFDHLLQGGGPVGSSFFGGYPAADLSIERRRKGLQFPAVMVSEALRARGRGGIARIKGLLEHARPHCRTGLRLVALGLAAAELGELDLHQDVMDELATPTWQHEASGLLRVLPDRASVLYSPLLMVCWCLDGGTTTTGRSLPDGFFDETEDAETVAWQIFTSDGEPHAVVDPRDRLVTHSLVDAWAQLHQAPSRPAKQRILIDAAYDGAVEGLERLWRHLFALMLHRQQRPLIRLNPWPAPSKAACSLRYDVDRAIGAARVRELVGMQSTLANAAFGSWYFRRDDPDEARFAPTLERYAQEQAKHVEHVDEVAPGIGVTHHSAPTSSYWEGDETTRALVARQADYGEYHAAELPTPRAAWLPDATLDDLSPAPHNLFLTALHFPLEGGTSDQGLNYFDQRLAAFRRRLAQGGHAIIGTHPDLNQAPLVDLFEREDFEAVWFATVETVIRRVRSVNAVRLVKKGDQLHLASEHSLADLSLTIWHADGSMNEQVLQLLPGRPRPLPSGESP